MLLRFKELFLSFGEALLAFAFAFVFAFAFAFALPCVFFEEFVLVEKDGMTGMAGIAGIAGIAGMAGIADTILSLVLPGTITMIATDNPKIVAPIITKGA